LPRARSPDEAHDPDRSPRGVSQHRARGQSRRARIVQPQLRGVLPSSRERPLAAPRSALGHRLDPWRAVTSEPEFTIGIEEEYFLVDRATRDVVSDPPPEMLAECEALLAGQVSPEFLRSQIEVGTRVCATLSERGPICGGCEGR